MHDILRERLWRHLEALPEERLYQVLDYVEFLSSKYAREPVRGPSSSIRRFGERLEDRLRANRVGLEAIRGTLDVMGAADRVVTGLADAGKSLLHDMEGTIAPPNSRPVRAAPEPPRERSLTPPPAPERRAPTFPIDE